MYEIYEIISIVIRTSIYLESQITEKCIEKYSVDKKKSHDKE